MFDIKKTATYGEYVINIASNNSVTVLKNGNVCDVAKAALRDVAALVGFDVDAKWTTQQLGSKLVDNINKGVKVTPVVIKPVVEKKKTITEVTAASELIKMVRLDVCKFLQNNEELLFNERDFQMHLATWLRKSDNAYDDVDVEYYVPNKELDNYIWESELRLDIVVKKNDEYCPVELKYKTKKVERKITRFDEMLSDDVVVMKNQGAQDLGMYDFWKDVRRVELVRNRFARVKGGLAVFLTNDEAYTKAGRPTSNNNMLTMENGLHPRQKHWLKPETTCARTHPDFEVENEYSIEWHNMEIDNVKFHYCCVVV